MRYHVVVSAENNPYMAWQCQLLHFSCATRLKLLPHFVLHETGAPLHPNFLDIVNAGGRLLSAPSYRRTPHGDTYPPRNTAGTLLRVADIWDGEDDFIILCDPDLLFVRAPAFPAALSASFYSYMNFDAEFVEQARILLDIPRPDLQAKKESLRCGTPYVIPARTARPLATAWLAALDAFPPRRWEDIMYAFGLATIMLGLDVELTRGVETNYRHGDSTQRPVLHYCYGDGLWNKRRFLTEEQAGRVWEDIPEADPSTILGAIVAQIKEARNFYRKHW